MGHGAIIYPDPSKPNHMSGCYEGSYFTGYKNYYQSAYSFFGGTKVVYTKMTSIDNRQGFGAAVAVVGNEYGTQTVEFNDNTIWGESEIPDCPPKGGYCWKGHKFGFISSASILAGKAIHITMPPPLPLNKIKGNAAWGGRIILNRNTFRDFKERTMYGFRQRVISISPSASDYTPMHEFYDTKMIDVEEGSLAYFYTPPKKWAIIKDCGQFPCTGPLNILYSFKKTRFDGDATPVETNP